MTSRRSIAAVAFLTGLLWATEGLALTPFHLWSKRFGGTTSDVGRAVAVDASGNVIITGQCEGVADFGGGGLPPLGSQDVFLAKYDANGNHQWSKRFGGTYAVGYGVATDASGNVYLTGAFQSSIFFGGLPLSSHGFEDVFVVKFNSSGTEQWSKTFGDTAQDNGYGIAVDASGNVICTGFFQGTIIVDGASMVSTGELDVFLVKWNTNGVFQWKQSFGGTSSDSGRGVAFDGAGNVFVTGDFTGTMANMGGASLVSAGERDIFLGKFNSSGTHQWSKRFGDTAYDSGADVGTDNSGNVFVTGSFSGTVNFGGGNVPFVGGSSDVFLAKFNTAGVHQWSKGFGGLDSDAAYSVAVDASGNSVIVGIFGRTTNLGSGDLTSAGLWDIFLARYDTNGTPRWTGAFGSTGFDWGFAVALGPAGYAYMTGSLTGTVNFGGSNLVSAGGNDVFLAAYWPDPTEPVISSITDVGNDQGRQVQIAFSRALPDDPASALPVIRYEAYRRINAPPAALTAHAPSSLSTRQLLDAGWTQVGSVNAHGKTQYSIAVPTIGDSTIALGQYRSVFFVRGATANSYTYYDSPPDSGYSVDNLAPAMPQSLAYDAGDLTWKESSAADFDYFTVYGSNTDSFGSATVVDYSVAPVLDVIASPYVFYYVTATDFSGNEGKPAKVNTLSDVGGTPTSYVLSLSNYPNPFNPRTTVRYTVPSRGAVTVTVYDARGARVATLLDHAQRPAGAYLIEWDGRAESGATVSTGVYFARIEHNASVRTRKMVMLK
jgi:hypothetical protein